MIDKISINGDWPEIENKELEKLIAQEFWCENKREDQANILYKNFQVIGSEFTSIMKFYFGAQVTMA
ncbi:hypothetical protein [Microbulbifer sp. JMSA003]|uniref:hypothetical protein n=1 Tax=Microbulbifer sp. JMSA003 TaxID=3243369 RepID=UPI004039B640